MFAAGNDRKVYKIRRRTKEKISVVDWQHNPVITSEPMTFTPGRSPQVRPKSVTLIKSAFPKNFTSIALQSTSDKAEQLIGDSQFCVSPVF